VLAARLVELNDAIHHPDIREGERGKTEFLSVGDNRGERAQFLGDRETACPSEGAVVRVDAEMDEGAHKKASMTGKISEASRGIREKTKIF
jgi:hypothetical protein